MQINIKRIEHYFLKEVIVLMRLILFCVMSNLFQIYTGILLHSIHRPTVYAVTRTFIVVFVLTKYRGMVIRAPMFLRVSDMNVAQY
jgi:hypothetical protein